MNSLFYNCFSLTIVRFGKFNTKNVIDMSSMFYNCFSIGSGDLNFFDTSKVKYMDEMFYGCINLVYLTITSFVGDSLISSKDIFKNTSTTYLYANQSFLNKLN